MIIPGQRILLHVLKIPFMKKFFSLLMTGLFIMNLSAQQVSNTNALLYQDYNEKSKKQKTWAWILTGGGTAMLLSGLIVYNSEQSYFPNQEVGTALMIGGGAAIVGGIVLFTASARNSRNAVEKEMSLWLKIENSASYQNPGIIKKSFPALAFHVKL